MATFERITKEAIPELRVGKSLVANFASVTQYIEDGSGIEVIVSESAEILWGKTKEDLIAEADKRIVMANKLIAMKQADIVEAQAAKVYLSALEVIGIVEVIKP